jgi:hypothetical protein
MIALQKEALDAESSRQLFQHEGTIRPLTITLA